ncbi:hypothetical protein DFH29DRAFT_1040601, partial [Suillus ampliporus]
SYYYVNASSPRRFQIDLDSSHHRVLINYLSVYLCTAIKMAPNRNTDRGCKYLASTSSNNQVNCQYCNRSYSACGIKSHEQGCLRRRDKKHDDKDFAALAVRAVEEELQRKEACQEKRWHHKEQTMTSAVTAAAALVPNSRIVPHGTQNSPNQDYQQDQQPDDFTAGLSFEGGSDVVDAMSTEYHPHSGRATSVETFSTFGCKECQQPPVIDDEPWQPFACRADFEFAELAHQAALNKNQTDELLRLIWRIADGQVKFTFKSHGDVSKAWDRAAVILDVPLVRETYHHQSSTMHEDLEYNVYMLAIVGLGLGLVTRPCCWRPILFGMHSDCTSTTGHATSSFVHEPWTGDRWWKVQSSLPENGVPFAFILNTDGLGGGRMVGWLPIVPDDSEEDGKLTYVNLKRVVWHKAFFKLLETIIIHAETGYAYTCYDGIMRWLYAFILLLSADYEEQCVMALIWGTNCYCPCPICLVPSDKLYDNASTYPTRSSKDMQALVELWTRDRVAGEKGLKKQGLRPVKNIFWKVPNSDPHDTISQDHLHVYHMGQWKHLFGELKQCIAALGRSAEKKLDDQCTVDKVGYALLWCIASYLHIDMYISLEVQTESTDCCGEGRGVTVSESLRGMWRDIEYIKIVEETEPDTMKNWNFPKIHSGKHIFDDIMAKGAARNFSTRPNEKQHGPIKCWYLQQTNRKDIANQILELDHKSVVSEFIRSQYREELEDMDEDDELFEEHFHIGSPLKNHTTLAQVEEENKSIHAFHQFRKKLTMFLNHFLPSHNIPLPEGTTWLRLSAQDQDKDGHNKNIFVKILCMFKHTVGNRTLDLALILPMDALIGPIRRMDRELRLTRLRARPPSLSEFITLHSIIRGALLVPDFANNGDYFLVDTVDTDMFLRTIHSL